MVRGSMPALSNAFPTMSPMSTIQTIMSSRISVNEDEYEEIITYNALMDFIKKNQENDAIVWQFQCIMGHQGPLLWHDKETTMVQGSMCWLNGRMGRFQRPCDLCCLCKRT
jgi:hypothetical protein